MLKFNRHEADIEEIARTAFPHVAEAMNFLRHHGFFAKDGARAENFLHISHTPPDPRDGRQWTILKTGPTVKTIASFDEDTGMPVYELKTARDRDITSLGETFEAAITKLATKVMLCYGG